jgi:hypothetical protein
LSADGSFAFTEKFLTTDTYALEVQSQPAGQICTISNGSGTFSTTNIANVDVDCVNTYSIGGVVTGLTAPSIVLQNNGGDNLTISANGAFIFSGRGLETDNYSITVLTQPSPATSHCTVTNASGTISSSNISNITVTCQANLKLFATAAYDGNHGGISGADGRCMSDSNYPGTGTYKAIIVSGTVRRACTNANCSSGSGEQIDWVLKPNRRYSQVDGTTLVTTTNNIGLFNYDFVARASTVSSNVFAWTGLDTDWRNSTTNCLAWTSSAGGNTGYAGNLTLLTSNAIGGGQGGCNGIRRLLCAEQ